MLRARINAEQLDSLALDVAEGRIDSYSAAQELVGP
jgi:hypothetical protein